MSIKIWADAARESQWRQSAEHQRAIDTLKVVFEGKEDPIRAASAIASIYNPLLKRGFEFSPVNEFWTMICEAAQILGGDREIDERLISLLNAISNLSDVTDKDGTPINGGSYSNYKVYWRELPSLAVLFREFAIDIEPGTSEMPDEGDWTDAQRATLLNVVTFSALYLTHGQRDIGMLFHAEVSLMEGVQEPYQTREQQRRAPTNVPPAATWILLAGKKIYELCKNGKDDKGRDFSLARWALWKEKFGEIAANEELDDSVRSIAEKASAEMESLEGYV